MKEKEKPAKDSTIKTIFRIIAMIVFGIFALFSLAIFNIFAFVILVIGIFLLLPHFNTFTHKYFKTRVPTKINIIVLIVLFILSFAIIIASNNIEQSPTGIIKQWIKYGNYKNTNELISNLQKMQSISSGTAHEQLILDHDYLDKQNQIRMEIIQSCADAKRLGTNICGNLSIELSMQGTAKLISQEILEQSDNLIKIKANIHKTTMANLNMTESTTEKTYILKKEGDFWKVNDFTQNSKYLSETLDMKKVSEDNKQSLDELNNVLIVLKRWVAVHKLISNIKSAVQDALPNNKIINFDFGGQGNQFVVGVTYYFKSQWPSDDYLWFLRDATKIYQATFTSSQTIDQVQITAKEQYKDNYGNTQERLLAKSLMSRPTADKINWAGFDSTKLDTITQVAFYGESTYKNLKNLEAALQSWQATPYYYDYAEPAPSDLCGDMKDQCQRDGECNDYETLKSFGTCR